MLFMYKIVLPQGGGCDPYFDVRLCVYDEKKGQYVMKKIFDYLKRKKKVK